MRKAPTRPSNDITQQYNSGIAHFYAIANTAEPGDKPNETPVEKCLLRYEELKLGIQRYYSGKQNQVKIERVIRCQFTAEVSSQDLVITEDGRQYRVDLVQLAAGVWPKSMDVTLADFAQKYEVPK